MLLLLRGEQAFDSIELRPLLRHDLLEQQEPLLL